MKVYKFGGASVKNVKGIKNLFNIVKTESEQLIIVVSAMGKTTNRLEAIHSAYYSGNTSEALALIDDLQQYHLEIVEELYCELNTNTLHHIVVDQFDELRNIIGSVIDSDFDRSYDKIVSYGEIISTLIVSDYLNSKGCNNLWVDMRNVLHTDSTYRDAIIDFESSRNELLQIIEHNSDYNLFVLQGFIGGCASNPTTLGREGSDYTAAVVANILDANSVTIWKDVAGIMNADPKLFNHAIHISELTYYDAVELAYSGAQVIHPKTIRPLENKHIPLYVRSFADPKSAGSVIKEHIAKPIDVPVYILRQNQVLVTIRPNDFSFVLEQSLSKLFNIVERYRLKVSLIQSSAVTVSICVDNSRYLADAIATLRQNYKVNYNDDLCLLTVRGTTPEITSQIEKDKDILLKQTTRRTVKIVYRK